MPKEIVVRYACNFCGAEEYASSTQAPAMRSLVLAAAEGTKAPELPKPLGFEACAACLQTGPVAALLAAGYPAGKAKEVAEANGSAPAGEVTCPECGAGFPTARGLSYHRSRTHGVESKTAQRMAVRGTAGEYVCEDCDFRSPRPQGLAAHRHAKHPAKAKRARRA